MSESAIQDQEFWAAYKAHVKCRHGIVHGGDRVDHHEAARSSLDAAVALFDYVESVFGRTPGSS